MAREKRIVDISVVLDRLGSKDLRDLLLRSVEAHPNLKASSRAPDHFSAMAHHTITASELKFAVLDPAWRAKWLTGEKPSTRSFAPAGTMRALRAKLC
jgi:hypothetical protein